MTFCVLTTDTTAALDTELHTQAFRDLTKGLPGLIGAWTVKFGPLNGTLAMQEAADAASLPTLPGPRLPADYPLQARERTLLQVLSPFTPHEGEFKNIELRAYEVGVGQGDAFVGLMLEALPVRTKYSPNLGVWRSVSGRVDRVYHMWGYNSVDDRDAVRGKLKDDGDWQAYVAKILPMMQSMRSTLLAPLPVR